MRSNAAASISGPTSVPSASGSPIGTLRVGLGEAVDELVADRVVDDQPAQARAALPGGADGGEGDAAHGQLEVGRRGDDRRVVAAELEDQPAEARGDDRGDRTAHPRRAGGRHDGDALVGGERGADVGAALQDLVEAVRRADVGGRPPQQRVARHAP